MVVDIGQVRQHIKPKADSTLHNMRKDDLIKYIRCLEHNYNVAVSFNDNQARYVESLDLTVQKWIPVSERLPDKPGDYLVLSKNRNYSVRTFLIYDEVRKEFIHIENGVITHWMPLPQPPKEET